MEWSCQVAEFVVRYTTTHERKVEADDLASAAVHAKRVASHVTGAKIVAVYDPRIILKPDAELVP